MNQYVITSRDCNDAGAPERPMKVRPGHVAEAKELKENDNFTMGGAILNESRQMIGPVIALAVLKPVMTVKPRNKVNVISPKKSGNRTK